MNAMMNPCGLGGIEFVEFASRDPRTLHELFLELGFSRVMEHGKRAVDLYRQGGITFLVNREPASHAAAFEKTHGPCIASMGWRTTLSAHDAARAAFDRGATREKSDYEGLTAIRGIGDSLIHFVPAGASLGFVDCAR